MHVLLESGIYPAGLSEASLRFWLTEAPKRLGFVRITPAIVEWRPPILAGIVLLAESHISAHINFAARRGWIDVFTCGIMERGIVVDTVNEILPVTECVVLERGLEFLQGEST